MRRLFYFTLLSCLSINCLGQALNETKLRSILVGKWINLDDSVLTVSISKDSIIEFTNGNQPESDLFTYRITRHNCDHKTFNKSTTGYYLTEKDKDDGECHCGAIQNVSRDEVTITFADDLLILKRIH